MLKPIRQGGGLARLGVGANRSTAVALVVLALAILAILSGFAAAALCPQGDLTGDCKVDWKDLQIFAEQWLDSSECEELPCADFDDQNGINFIDFAFLASSWQAHGVPLVINEFMASNNSESDINDPQGDYDDWVEIYNFGDLAIDLGGMYLTDDLNKPTEWQIPEGYPAETTVPAHGFILFWADRDTGDGPLHADFKLSADGENIGLFLNANTMIDGIIFGQQTANISYGRYPDANDNMCFFIEPTPLASNKVTYENIVEQPEFSHERGFYATGFNVTIATTTDGADIYYTKDGSEPIVNEVPSPTSTKYTGAIAISSSTCLRAAAIKTGWMTSRTTTHTYIFGASAAIKSMPVVCLVGDEHTTFFEPDGIMAIVGGTYVDGVWTSGGAGTYNNPIHRGREYERPVSFEIIDPNASTNLQIDCGIRVHGSDYTRPRYTRGDDWLCTSNKFSFNLWFRSDYGDNRLEYPFFPFIDVDRFGSIVLRGGHNDICSPFVKDEWMRRLFKEMGGVQETGTFANLYINGAYKYYYNPTGRADKEFYQEWYDTNNDFDVITQSDNPGIDDVRDGDGVAWCSLLNYVDSYNLADVNAYEYVASKFDIPLFVDYLILQIYSSNFDWPNNNWEVHRERSDTGKFRFSVWDAEGIEKWVIDGAGMGVNAFTDMPWYGSAGGGLNGGPWDICRLYRSLKANPDFKQLFADRIHKHFRNGGILTKNHLLAKWWEVLAEVSAVLPYLGDYENFIPNTFIPNREPYVLAAFEDNDLFNLSLEAPTFNVNGSYKHGGYISTSDTITIINPNNGTGTIYYTLDGNDPRLSSSESSSHPVVTLVNENAFKRYLVPTGPVASTGSILREYWTGISGTAVSDLTSNPNFPNNPSGSNMLTSFEAPTNWADNYGTRIRGYIHPPTTASYYYFWIASDDNSELWLSTNDNPANKVKIANVPEWTNPREWTKYPTAQKSTAKSLTAGQKYYIEALMKEGSGGDNLAVAWQGPGITQRVIDGQYLSPVGENWFTNNFNDSTWPSGTGGIGYEASSGYESYIDIDVKAQMYNNYTSCYIRIPFTVDGNDLSSFGSLTLRVMFDDGFVAYINGAEVKRDNFSGTPAWNSVADNYLETGGYTDYDITSHINKLQAGNNILAIHGMNNSTTSSDFLILAELVATEIAYGDISPGAIAYSGGFHLDKSTHLKSRVYKSSTGQWSALNEAVYALPEVADNLRITEIMYHPQDTNDPNDPNEEYIELKNIGASAINLNLVRFTKGIDFTFGDVDLAAGGYILVVKNKDAFEAEYGTGKPVAGVYSGSLANDGERIRLEDALGKVIHDFQYKDNWYDITDGAGYSLTIINPNNPDPNSWAKKDSWRASAYTGGSPGTDDSGIVPNPGDIVINEVMTHSHAGAPDWIELHNTTASAINIGGWYLSDSNSNLMKYRIANGTTINSGGYLVFYENTNFGEASSDPGRLIPFALSENGEMVCLTSALDANGILTGYRQEEDFEASETGVSFGQYYNASTSNFDFVALDHNTPGLANTYPKIGPIVISEIMYHPNWPVGGAHTNDEYEYIELFNISSGPVTLYDYAEGAPWKFTDGIDYTFPASPHEVTIPAGGRIVVVKDVNAFAWRYPSVPTSKIYGPYSDWLANDGEKVELSKPGDEHSGTRYYIRVDRVSYSDGSHPQDCPGDVDLWPIEADGSGDSLNRIDPNLYGNDPNNWTAGSPSPGTANP